MKKKKFSTKLLISSLRIGGSVLLVFLCISIVSKYYAIREKNLMKQQLAVENVTIQLNNYVSNMSFVSLDILCRNEFIDAAKILHYSNPEKTDSLILQENFQILKNTLLSYSLSKTSYQVVFFNTQGYFVTNYGYGFDYRYGYKIEDDAIDALDWKEEAVARKGAEYILPLHETEFFNDRSKVISIVRTVQIPGKPIGFLVVQTNIENMHYIFDAIDQSYELLVLDEQDNLIYSTTKLNQEELSIYGQLKNADENNHYKNPITKKTELINHVFSEDTGWTVYVMTGSRQIFKELFSEIKPLLWSTILLFVMVFLFCLKVAGQLAKPMTALARQMEALTLDCMDKDVGFCIQNEYKEIEDLSMAFSDMRLRLNDMINKEIMYQTLQLEERFKTLQSQINPHFMYNTLGVIGIMGAENGNENVFEACRVLADLLKYSISDPKQYVTFEQEFWNAQCYLELLKIRYEHKLNFSIILEESLKEMNIPKLTLQPLIENIIKHGYGERCKYININLSAVLRGNHWFVRIEDDGQGFSNEAIHRIHDRLSACLQQNQFGTEKYDPAYGMGIVNTFVRLHIFFHNAIDCKFGNRKTGGAYIQLSSFVEE